MKKNIYNFICRCLSMDEKHFLLLLVLAVFIVCLFRSLFGVDMTDTGYLLTGYQQIFKNPSAVESMFGIYDTILIGGIWESFFSVLGLFGFKILSALVITTISLFVYSLLKRYINRWLIFIGFIFLVITGRYLVFHYDLASALVSVIAVFLLFNSLKNENICYIFGAGCIIGISLFVRFPNVAQVGYILILIPFYIIKRNITIVFRLFCFAILGFLSGVILNVTIAIALGHYEYLYGSFNGLISTLFNSNASNSSYGLSYLIQSYKNSYVNVLKLMYPLFFYSFVDFMLCRLEFNKLVKIIALILVNAIFGYILLKSNNVVLLHAFCCSVFVFALICREKLSEDIIYLMCLSFMMMFFLPLGSDAGLYNIGVNCLFLSFPLALGIAFDLLLRKNTRYNKYMYVVVFVVFCIFSVFFYKSINNSYRDTGSIYEMNSSVEQSCHFVGFTSFSKAFLLDDLLLSIKPYISPDSELLAYPSIPMINYLTCTKPYLNNPWIGIMNISDFKKQLSIAERTKQLPIIVIAKAPDEEWFLPNDSWTSIEDCDDWHASIKEKNVLLKNFVEVHKYNIHYDNDMFQVLIPCGYVYK